MSGNNIKVVVRCRPLNAREKARGAHCLIRMEGNKTILSKPPTPGSNVLEDPKAFTFDESYWSAVKSDPDYADQERVYNDLGKEVLDHAFNGYNCCIFAYGQTGSGKSYSMVGYGEEKGIIPRTCSELFDRVDSKRSDVLDFQVEVSYIEIYNEKVRDLLNPANTGNLKVREHPVLGPYVQDLSRLAVNSYKNLDQLMDEGNKARTVAATNMNETSSRSHAVFTIFVTQKILDPNTKQVAEKVARISLVDLAGSERANSTGATGVRLKEGANINKSLTTLGKVIAGLAEQASGGDKKSNKKKEAFIPYRDSVLTWLLKDSLGGNSKTCMIAAISPADYDETLSTLRYADQAKKIKTKAVVNEDPNAKMMRELKEEVEALRQALMVYAPEQVEKIAEKAHPQKGQKSSKKPTDNTLKVSTITPSNTKSTIVFTDASGKTTQLTKDEMVEQLQTSEKLLGELNQTWEEKLKNTEKVQSERETLLKNLGITIENNQVGLYTPKEIPYLINLNEDPLMSECLMYNIQPGITFVDTTDDQRSDGHSSIRLSGSNINRDHCYFENKEHVVTLYPREGCTAMVNGMRISEPKRLKSGYRIILGDHHVFRFNHPSEALKERQQQQQQQQDEHTPILPPSPTSSDSMTPPSPLTEIVDWNFARREAMLNTFIHDSSFDNFSNQDLDKLFDDVAKIRMIRKRQSTCSDTRTSTTTSSVRRSVYSSIFLDDDNSCYTTDASTISSFDEELDSRQKYQVKLRRLSRHLSQPILLSAKERDLASRVVQHWKKQKNVAMAKTILTHEPYLRQANLLSSKSNKNVFYQFTVVHDHMSATAISHWDTTSNTVDADLIKATKPCIAVQVIDRKHETIYSWSIEKFMARLRYLQGSFFASDSKKYIKGDDLFYDPSAPSFVLVGLAKVSLRNLMTQVPVESAIGVYCRNTGRLMGQLRVLIAPIARSVRFSEESQEPVIDNEDPRRLLHVGQQLVFEISIIELSGLDPQEFSRVHAQFRLSTFGDHFDGVFASTPKDYQTESIIEFNYHQTLSMAVTEQVLNVIETKEITFEIYGKPHQKYLSNMATTALSSSSMNDIQDIVDTVIPTKKPDSAISRIQICEITSSGDYKPVPIESIQADALGQHDTFSLQQGQQRRIVLTLTSPVAFDKITDICVGQIRLVDGKHRTIDTPNDSLADVSVNMISATKKDDTWTVHASWDSSLHNTILLNAITPNHQKVAMTISWHVRQGGETNFQFEQQVFVHVKDQVRANTIKRSQSTRRASNLFSFFAKSIHMKTQVTALHHIDYKPELLGTFLDLPLMELPSRILREYHENRCKMESRQHLDAIRYSVFLSEQLDRLCGPTLPQNSLDIQTIVNVWQNKSKNTLFIAPSTDKIIKPTVRRWLPQVHHIMIPMHEDIHLKKGFLLLQKANNQNVKYWCVLAGRYLFLYQDQFEVNEVDILNIKSIESMKSKTVFTVDTLYGSHTFQALDHAAMIEWTSMLN